MILVSQRDKYARGTAPCPTSCVQEKHQGQQPHCLGFVRQKIGQQPAQIKGFIRQSPDRSGFSGGRIPACSKGGMDSVEHIWQSVGHHSRFRHFEPNPRITDLVLYPDRSLTHPCPWHHKRTSDPRGIKAENGLKHQGRARAGSIAGCTETKSSASRSSAIGRASATRSS